MASVINIYLDESGDTGFKLGKGLQRGGSSQHLTLCYAMLPEAKAHLPGRVLRKVYNKFGFSPKLEKKGSTLNAEQRIYFLREVRKLLKREPEIKIGHITVMKKHVRAHIRREPEKLYTYMMNLALLPKVVKFDQVNLIRDNRSVKIESGNSLSDYLQMQLWFHYNATTLLNDYPSDSKAFKGLMFIDWMSNIVWRHFEQGENEVFRNINEHLIHAKLFFRGTQE